MKGKTKVRFKQSVIEGDEQDAPEGIGYVESYFNEIVKETKKTSKEGDKEITRECVMQALCVFGKQFIQTDLTLLEVVSNEIV
jgi:hypothetical protein